MHPHCIFGHIFNFAKDKFNGKREEVCATVKRYYRVCIILLQKLYSLKLFRYSLVGMFSLITLKGKRNVEGYSIWRMDKSLT